MKKLLICAALCCSMRLVLADSAKTALTRAAQCCREGENAVAADAECQCPEGCKCDKCEACKENCDDAGKCKGRKARDGDAAEVVEYVLDEDGNPVLDEDGNPIPVKPAADCADCDVA